MLQKSNLIIIVVLIILVSSLGGCLESHKTEINEKSLFIGIWKMLEPEGEDHNSTLIFYQNDTYKQTFDNEGEQLIFWGTYKIEKDKIVTTSEDDPEPKSVYYIFSNENKHLTLSDENGSVEFDKISDDAGD